MTENEIESDIMDQLMAKWSKWNLSRSSYLAQDPEIVHKMEECRSSDLAVTRTGIDWKNDWSQYELSLIKPD